MLTRDTAITMRKTQGVSSSPARSAASSALSSPNCAVAPPFGHLKPKVTSTVATSKAAQETAPTSSSQPAATTSAASSPGQKNSWPRSCRYGERSAVYLSSIRLLNGRRISSKSSDSPLCLDGKDSRFGFLGACRTIGKSLAPLPVRDGRGRVAQPFGFRPYRSVARGFPALGSSRE